MKEISSDPIFDSFRTDDMFCDDVIADYLELGVERIPARHRNVDGWPDIGRCGRFQRSQALHREVDPQIAQIL